MNKRFRYERPMLVDLRDDLSCAGAVCSNGFDINLNSCMGGSCEAWNMCGTGTSAEACCSGKSACSLSYFGSCETGTGVTGACAFGGDATASTRCACTPSGSSAGVECVNGSITLADGGSGGCGCGMNHGT
jgi:hypothetical protein